MLRPAGRGVLGLGRQQHRADLPSVLVGGLVPDNLRDEVGVVGRHPRRPRSPFVHSDSRGITEEAWSVNYLGRSPPVYTPTDVDNGALGDMSTNGKAAAATAPSSCAAVTNLIQEWAAVRPDLDTSAYRVFASAAELTRQLTVALAPAFDAHGIKGGDYEVLSHLRRAGPPYEASPTELSQLLYVTTGAMTRRIDCLEAARYLQRLPHGSDRRSTVVRLTPAGIDVVDATVEQILARLGPILEPVRDRTSEFEDLVRLILTRQETSIR
jgi:DNA-binding MarR family transcriptional regulator